MSHMRVIRWAALAAPMVFVFACTAAPAGDFEGLGEDEVAAAAAGKGDDWRQAFCEARGWYGDGICGRLCPNDSDCLEGSVCEDNSSCGIDGFCHCNECFAGDVSLPEICPAPPLGSCDIQDHLGCARRDDCNWIAAAGGGADDGLCIDGDPCGGACDPLTEFCRELMSGDFECHAFAREGDLCGGFVPYWIEEQCGPGYHCEVPSGPMVPTDGPGTCVEDGCGGPMDAIGIDAPWAGPGAPPPFGCFAWFGWKWNGLECEDVMGCSCEGDDCDSLYDTEAQCLVGVGCGAGMDCQPGFGFMNHTTYCVPEGALALPTP